MMSDYFDDIMNYGAVTRQCYCLFQGKGEMATHWLIKKTTDGTLVSPAKVKLPTLNIPSSNPNDAKKEETPAEA